MIMPTAKDLLLAPFSAGAGLGDLLEDDAQRLEAERKRKLEKATQSATEPSAAHLLGLAGGGY